MGTAVAGSGIDRTYFERQWANHEARLKLSGDDWRLWEGSRHTFRPYVYFDKVLIAWTLVNGQPKIKEVFKVIGVEVTFQDGIWLRLHAEYAKRDVTLSHTPRRLLPSLDVIGWVPYFNEVRFVSPDWNDFDARKNMRLCACFKMRSRGDTERRTDAIHEGHDFLTELHVFRDLWPSYADKRF